MSDLNTTFGLNNLPQQADPEAQSNVVKADFSSLTIPTNNFGNVDGTANRQWASRPDDERFVTMDELHAEVTNRRLFSQEIEVDLTKVQATVEDGRLKVKLPGVDNPVEMTHYSFSSLCTAVRAPARWLRRLPNAMAADNINFGLDPSECDEPMKKALLHWKGTDGTLRALTGKDYGRVWDNQVSEVMMRLANDHGWEVPIAFHRPGNVYNPVVAANVTKESTTLYSGDRTSFMFLVDQRNPVEAGKLPDGSPRLFFKGIYAGNSEVGDAEISFGTFLYEMTCANRNIWGQAGMEKMSRRHSKFVVTKFDTEMVPSLLAFINGESIGIETALKRSMEIKLPTDQNEVRDYMRNLFKLSEADLTAVRASILAEEGHEPQTVFDLIQGLTATARAIPYAKERLERETMAAKFLQLVTA